MPKISVCIPAYNVEDYIEECLDSILCQTFKDIEIIVVDDGSTDNTGRILDGINDARLKVLHKSNGGVVSARKAAIANATTDYIVLVDADDYLADRACEVLYQNVMESNAEVVFSQSYFNDYNSVISNISKQLQNGVYSIEKGNMDYIWDHLMGRTFSDRIAGLLWTSLYKKEVAEKAFAAIPDEQSQYEDMDFMIVLGVTAKSVCIIDEPLYYYRYRKNSATHPDGSVPGYWNERRIQERFERLSKCLKDHVYSKSLLKQLKGIEVDFKLGYMGVSSLFMFPYEKVPQGSRIILYGAATVGWSYYNQIQVNHYCQIAAWVDIRFSEMSASGIVSPDEIPHTEYDYVLLAVLSVGHAASIAEQLVQKYQIKEEAIIIHEPKSIVDFMNIQ